MIDRIDYADHDLLDDVSVKDIELFRLEKMDDGTIWIKLYRKDSPDLVIWLFSKTMIYGRHEYEEEPDGG